MHVQPYLFFDGRCEQALQFYRAALGAEVTMLMRNRESPEPAPPGAMPPGSEDKVLHAAFRIGDTHYRLSERADLATLDNGASGQPDLPWAGSVLVELPLSALEDPAATHAVISFAGSSGPLGGGDLDGALEYTFDLTALDHEKSVTISEPSRVAPSQGAG